jgi:hypothetical protein
MTARLEHVSGQGRPLSKPFRLLLFFLVTLEAILFSASDYRNDQSQTPWWWSTLVFAVVVGSLIYISVRIRRVLVTGIAVLSTVMFIVWLMGWLSWWYE